MKRRSFLALLPASITTLPAILKGQPHMYAKNTKLKTIKANFPGNTIKDGEFVNLYGESGNNSIMDILKWKLFSSNSQKKAKDEENYVLNVVKDISILEEKRDYIYWLGHASFLIQIDGKRIITDPCLTAPPLMKRLRPLPLEIKDLNPDYLLISHGHYDHLDGETIKQFPKCEALIPLKMGKLVKGMNDKIITQEAGWYQQYNLNEDFDITFLPAHHWHKRGLTDFNEVLWGSFLIKTKTKTIYFAGDTGYSKHFKHIHDTIGDVDIAIMPIGAYAPRWFMRQSHIDPHEALQASKEMHAKTIIPMHFGTFDLTDEPLGEPERIFGKICTKNEAHFLDIGGKMLL